MPDASVRTLQRIAAPPARVWAYLGDPARLVGLNPDLLELLDLTPAGPLQAGQHWTERQRTPLGTQQVRTRVALLDAATGRIRLDGAGPLGLHIAGDLQVRPAGTETEVSLENRLSLPGGPLLGGTALAVLAGQVRAGSRAALIRLAAAVAATP